MKGRTLTILLTGGGTGGHITPLLAVAHKLKETSPDCRIVYIGERNGKYASMLDGNTDIDEIHTIFAGKFRRYHGETWVQRMTDIKTLLLNLRDVVFFLIGGIQCLYLVPRLKPDVAFLKGGFVGVPIGLACALWRCPFVTHDSDALPGLANRIVARWAKVHATAMPANYYTYPKDSTIQVGVLVGPKYLDVTPKEQAICRKQLAIPIDAQVLMITGGSNGATVINNEIARFAEKFLSENPKLYIVHQVGVGKKGVYKDYTNSRLQVYELLKDMHIYSGAADVIVTRAGANTLAEFGVQRKTCIVVPNPILTGGHQLINANYLQDQQAAIIVNEESFRAEQGSELWQVIQELLLDKIQAGRIASNLHNITIKDAASQITKILTNVAEGKNGNKYV